MLLPLLGNVADRTMIKWYENVYLVAAVLAIAREAAGLARWITALAIKLGLSKGLHRIIGGLSKSPTEGVNTLEWHVSVLKAALEHHPQTVDCEESLFSGDEPQPITFGLVPA